MKWWGWGEPHKLFDIQNRPGLWTYMVKSTGIKNDKHLKKSITPLEQIILPEPQIHSHFLIILQEILQPEQITYDSYERMIHAYGKSFRDLLAHA